MGFGLTDCRKGTIFGTNGFHIMTASHKLLILLDDYCKNGRLSSGLSQSLLLQANNVLEALHTFTRFSFGDGLFGILRFFSERGIVLFCVPDCVNKFLDHGLFLTRKVFLLFRPRNFPLFHLSTFCNVNIYNRCGLGRWRSTSCSCCDRKLSANLVL
jgi:hypothetical protein